mmetsp:Transcript_21449/g.64344  ORF Transcript_21449/g.64344 Transcript_21449/m.64344 type:complete len:396 (-) Transcript_21449:217-1404(-)
MLLSDAHRMPPRLEPAQARRMRTATVVFPVPGGPCTRVKLLEAASVMASRWLSLRPLRKERPREPAPLTSAAFVVRPKRTLRTSWLGRCLPSRPHVFLRSLATLPSLPAGIAQRWTAVSVLENCCLFASPSTRKGLPDPVVPGGGAVRGRRMRGEATTTSHSVMWPPSMGRMAAQSPANRPRPPCRQASSPSAPPPPPSYLLLAPTMISPLTRPSVSMTSRWQRHERRSASVSLLLASASRSFPSPRKRSVACRALSSKKRFASASGHSAPAEAVDISRQPSSGSAPCGRASSAVRRLACETFPRSATFAAPTKSPRATYPDSSAFPLPLPDGAAASRASKNSCPGFVTTIAPSLRSSWRSRCPQICFRVRRSASAMPSRRMPPSSEAWNLASFV